MSQYPAQQYYNNQQRPQQGFAQIPPNQYPQQPQYPQQQFPQQSQFPQQYGTPQYAQPPQPQPNQYPQPQYPQQQYPPQPYQQAPRVTGWYASYYDQLSPMELQNHQAWFIAVDRDRSGTISATELATMPLGNGQLGIDCAKKLIKAFDKNYSGNIDFYEYATLNQFIAKMQAAFYAADRDRSGYLDYREIYNALAGAGFSCSVNTVQSISKKYDNGYGVSISGFVAVCAHLAAVRTIFEFNDTSKTGYITLNYDQLANITMHLADK